MLGDVYEFDILAWDLGPGRGIGNSLGRDSPAGLISDFGKEHRGVMDLLPINFAIRQCIWNGLIVERPEDSQFGRKQVNDLEVVMCVPCLRNGVNFDQNILE